MHDPEYLEAHAKFDALNDPQVEAKAKKMLDGLGFKERDFHRPAREMSGGWIMRAHLARLLVMEPDLLLLDEPTNHLDLLSLIWLQNYLKTYSGAILLISHDRQFMDELAARVYEIANNQLISYTGNYSSYLEQREAQLQPAARRIQEPAKGNPGLAGIRGPVPLRLLKVRPGPEQAQADRAHGPDRKAAPAAQALPVPDSAAAAHRAARPRPRGHPDGLWRQRRLPRISTSTSSAASAPCSSGPNGAGKSTLLKILAGVLPFQKGERKEGNSAKIGYFSQHRSASLDPAKTVLEEVMASAADLREDDARAVLGSFMFRKEEIYKKTEVLSGGEKSRLNLVKFLVDPPNLLLMDEPTTHLDILTVESLSSRSRNTRGHWSSFPTIFI